MTDVSLIFDNNKVDCSGHMEMPTKTGEYLVYIAEVESSNCHFTEIYFRTDTNKFYFHTWCELENDLESYWHCEVVHWMLLKEMSLDDFEKH